MNDLFSSVDEVVPGMIFLPGFVDTLSLKGELDAVLQRSPLRHMQTSRGFQMSVKTSNCGSMGWISDRKGYRYSETDPVTGLAWPAMPSGFLNLAKNAAEAAGYPAFLPDVCLMNFYEPGTQMGAHQDRDEASFEHPIVSVSLGIAARFFVIGPERRGKSIAVDLADGDVIVFGGESRKYYHGVRKIKQATHPVFGPARWNLTFRRAA